MSGHVKLAIIGGGAFRTPRLIYGLIRHAYSLNIRNIDLYDPDFARMEGIVTICRHVAQKLGSPLVLTPRRSVEDTCRDADFVFLTYRVGGDAGRAFDERCALNLSVLGQETVGPGGFFMALRSIPETLSYVERIRDVAPNAWIINFTNPAGIVTESAIKAGETRFIGVCDTPYHLQLELAEFLDLNADDLEVETVGLNHLGWFTRVGYDGQDLLPGLINDISAVRAAIRPLSFFTPEEIRRFGALPTEYVFFYLHAQEVVSRTRGIKSRGETLRAMMASFFPEFQQLIARGAVEEAWALYGSVIAGRSNSYLAAETASPFARGLNPERLFNSEGYEGVAIRVMEGLLGQQTRRAIINVCSQGLVAGIASDAVIECACAIGNDQIKPLNLTVPAPRDCLDLIRQTKTFEEHTIAAALSKRIEDAAQALMLHPVLQGDQALAWRIVQTRRDFPQAPTLVG